MNNRVQNTDIFVNKYVRSFCFMESKSTKKSNKRTTSFVIELDGRFYRDGLLKTEEDMKLAHGLVQTYDEAVTKTEEQDGRMFVYLSRVSIQNLVKQIMQNEMLKSHMKFEPFYMTVEQLEDAGLEGYSNVFGEKEKIAITTSIHQINTNNILFEEAFGSISFSAIFRMDFSNPRNPDWLSATSTIAMRGSLTPYMTDNSDFAFTVMPEQVKVTDFTPYFLSELTLNEVENAFKKAMAPKLLGEINKRLSIGVNLPIGTGKEMVHPGKKMIHLHKDMIVVELGQL